MFKVFMFIDGVQVIHLHNWQPYSRCCMHTKNCMLKHVVTIGACVQKGFVHACLGGLWYWG
jgi:hypothetical protein